MRNADLGINGSEQQLHTSPKLSSLIGHPGGGYVHLQSRSSVIGNGHLFPIQTISIGFPLHVSSCTGATVLEEPWHVMRRSRSSDFRLQFLTAVIFRSSAIECSHPTASLPTRRVPSGLCRVNFLQGSCSCVLKRCPSHLSRPTLIIFTISGSLYNL
jgi:hypothetical protein